MKDRFYYPELDGLRFLAFFAVFVQHGPVMQWLAGYMVFVEFGWIGVDLFLCLSAFLFVHLLRMEWEKTGRIHIAFFYLRRSLRIWPIYFIFTGVVILFSLAAGRWTGAAWLRAIGLFTFTDNLLSAFSGNNLFIGLPHLWTISYEEQFYVAIPWFLRYMFQQSRNKQAFVLGLILLGGTIVRAVFIFYKVAHPAIWVLPVTHFESILLGLAVGLGLFDVVFRRVPVWIITLASAAGLVFCTRLGNVYAIDWPLMQLYPLAGLSVSLLVYATLRSRQQWATGWLRFRPVAFLGKISYGLYLFHYIVLQVVNRWLPLQLFENGKHLRLHDLTVFLAALSLTIALAAISYIVIEKPFLNMKSRFTIVQSRPV